MKVAFITHYTALYGANRSLLNLIDGLATLGVDPFVVVPGSGDITSALQERGIPFTVLDYRMWSSIVTPGSGLYKKILKFYRWRKGAFSRLTRNAFIIPRLSRQLKEWDIDIIYSNSSVIPVGAMAAMRLGKPHVWHLREFGDLDYGYTPDWGKALTSFLLRKAAAQLCVSEAIRTHYASGLVKDSCHVVYNGVATRAEMDRFHQIATSRTGVHDTFIFAIVGLIHPGKGQDTAIRAIALLKETCPGVRLIIAGGGEKKPLEELAVKLGVSEQVTFLGYVADPYEVYLQSDAVLMCSKNEAMGRVTVEAMAAAKPVIGCNSCGTKELILHEYNGLLYDETVSELASCMRRLVENPAWASAMGENGWRIAREKYSIETYAGRVYEILAGLHGQNDN